MSHHIWWLQMGQKALCGTFFIQSGQFWSKKAVYCKHCLKDITYSNNSTNLRQQLGKWRPRYVSRSVNIYIIEIRLPWYISVKPASKHVLIVKDMCPVGGFLALMSTMDHAYQVSSRNTMTNIFKDMYLDMKSCLMTQISGLLWQVNSEHPLLSIHIWVSLHILLLNDRNLWPIWRETNAWLKVCCQ